MNRKPYLLNEEELVKLAIFNGIDNSYGFMLKTPEMQIKKFENTIFNNVIKNAPTLKNTIEQFYKAYPKDNKAVLSVFKTILKDKISVREFGETLFTSSYTYEEDHERIVFLKKLHEKYPPLVFMLHKYIHDNRNNSLSNVLYDAYFQILKNKNTKILLNQLNKVEIIENINSFKPRNIQGIKKKLNAYLNNFERKEPLYKHISNELREEIKNFGLIKNFWDEKVKLFPKEIQDKHYISNKNEVVFPWGEEKEYYTYNIKFNKQFFIQKTNYSETTIENLMYTFSSKLSDFIELKFEGVDLNRKNNPFDIYLSFESKDNKDKAKMFTSIIINNLEDLINNYFNKDKQNNMNTEELNKYFEKLYFSFELDKQLTKKEELNNSSEGSTKRKISKV